ncbi:MAG: response regulator [Ignavibacteriaceae bacterium]|nr:response regulator [Ignavibacteriaceae bacterium]
MIYIIDDDRNVRDGYMMLLKSAGFKCSSFESAEEFLKNYNAGENLPGMNGCSLLELIRENNMHLPVIIITAYDEQATRTSAKNYGAIAYLRKPVDGTALIDVIRYKSDISLSPNNNSQIINRSTL